MWNGTGLTTLSSISSVFSGRGRLAMAASAAALLAATGTVTAQHGGTAGDGAAAATSAAEGSLALGGVDPVSLFHEGGAKPTAGSGEFAVTHLGRTYHFASSDNMELFQSNIERYAPVYGGHAADALAKGEAKETDGQAWSIVGNVLFVFTDTAGRDAFLADFDNHVTKANETYKAVTGQDSKADLSGSLKRVTDKYDLGRRDLAIEGYDPVAYFPEAGGEPVRGDRDITYDFRGVTYRFANEANLELFKTNPSRYEPAFGGWCAYAAAQETYTEPQPKNFQIREGRLLLFYRGLFGDTLKDWNEEGPAQLEPKANAFWTEETGEVVHR